MTQPISTYGLTTGGKQSFIDQIVSLLSSSYDIASKFPNVLPNQVGEVLWAWWPYLNNMLLPTDPNKVSEVGVGVLAPYVQSAAAWVEQTFSAFKAFVSPDVVPWGNLPAFPWHVLHEIPNTKPEQALLFLEKVAAQAPSMAGMMIPSGHQLNFSDASQWTTLQTPWRDVPWSNPALMTLLYDPRIQECLSRIGGAQQLSKIMSCSQCYTSLGPKAVDGLVAALCGQVANVCDCDEVKAAASRVQQVSLPGGGGQPVQLPGLPGGAPVQLPGLPGGGGVPATPPGGAGNTITLPGGVVIPAPGTAELPSPQDIPGYTPPGQQTAPGGPEQVVLGGDKKKDDTALWLAGGAGALLLLYLVVRK